MNERAATRGGPRFLFEGSEDDLVFALRALAARRALPRGLVGIGDDAAVLPGRPSRVVSIDLLVEGQHFRRNLMTPEDLAWRALEANLSDVAGMGARPLGIFLGLAWPATTAYRRWGGRLLDELIRAGAERGAPVLGGDTVRAQENNATVAITVVGTPHPGGPVLRSGGKAGDLLAVTGPLGASAVGLALLEGAAHVRPRDRTARDLAESAVRAFRRPRARLDLARPLARYARALMDISDGLGIDLPRLAAASGCGFRVDAGAIPVHPVVSLVARDREDAVLRALGGGEDFELLAAVPPGHLSAVRRAASRGGAAVYVIGVLASRRAGGSLVWSEGKRSGWPRKGWDPFDPGPTFASR